jgi:GAF domain-containing protein
LAKWPISREDFAVLTQLTQRLHAQRTFETALATVLDDAISLHGAEFGTMQLPVEDNLLLIVDQRGFKPAFLETFREVRPTDGCACGRALRSGRPLVIVDVQADEEFRPFRAVARRAGYRSVETTPLLTSTNFLMGILSTHFATIHSPTDIEMSTLIA